VETHEKVSSHNFEKQPGEGEAHLIELFGQKNDTSRQQTVTVKITDGGLRDKTAMTYCDSKIQS
jgi:hypothetical protein